MKIFVSVLCALLLFTLAGSEIFAQKTKTIILLRHAEKDLLDDAKNSNPNLSSEGELRAQNLVKKLKKYKPKAIYSTDFTRTRLTALPLSIKRNVLMRIYDHKKLEEFAKQLLESKESRIVVVGHNTTTPGLANLLIRQNKYQPLDESEYDKIWIIKIKKGKTEDKIIVY